VALKEVGTAMRSKDGLKGGVWACCRPLFSIRCTARQVNAGMLV